MVFGNEVSSKSLWRNFSLSLSPKSPRPRSLMDHKNWVWSFRSLVAIFKFLSIMLNEKLKQRILLIGRFNSLSYSFISSSPRQWLHSVRMLIPKRSWSLHCTGQQAPCFVFHGTAGHYIPWWIETQSNMCGMLGWTIHACGHPMFNTELHQSLLLPMFATSHPEWIGRGVDSDGLRFL